MVGNKFITGLHYSKGSIAELGNSHYSHFFGGNRWATKGRVNVDNPPVLLLTLDLSDPKLSQIKRQNLNELPIASYCSGLEWTSQQTYKLDVANKICIEVGEGTDVLPIYRQGEIALKNIPERHLNLREMRSDEIPTDETSYWTACDSFLGDASFLRVLGPPVWLQDPSSIHCHCGSTCCVGCVWWFVSLNAFQGYLPNRAFFIGEGALYFFLCDKDLHINVVSQSS